MKDFFIIADKIISETYPDINNRGAGWWGDKLIPNYGILRENIAKTIASEQNVKKDAQTFGECYYCKKKHDPRIACPGYINHLKNKVDHCIRTNCQEG